MTDKEIEKWRDNWKKEHTERFTVRINKDKEKDLLDHMKCNAPYQTFVKRLIRNDMDTHRKWAICMGVAMAAEQARRFNWKELYEQLGKLSAELGRELGLTPDQVYREAHQVQERERL